MIMAGPIVINACAAFPSGPALRFSSTAPKAFLQKSISAATSRQNSLGMTTELLSGIPFIFMAPPQSILFSLRLLFDKRCNSIICEFRLVIQKQSARTWNGQQSYLQIPGECIPRVKKTGVVPTLSRVGKKLLIEPRPERQQRDADLGKLTGIIGSHELAKIADLHRQRNGFNLL